MKANLNMNFSPSSQRGSTINEFKYNTNQPITIYQSQQAQLEQESFTEGPFKDLNFSYVTDPVLEIEKCTGVLIRQFPDEFKFVSGCEGCNKFYIFGITDEGYKYLFNCKESIDCFMQYFCPISNKKINMNLIHDSSNPQTSQGVKIGTIDKPFRCACCCICRPELILTLVDSNETIGKIKEEFSLFDDSYKVINIKNTSRYRVRASICQCGLCCSNTVCGNNCDTSFYIEEPITHEPLGSITKQNIGDKQNPKETYEIKFPRKANSNDKLLLTSLGIMLDYQFFDIDPMKFKNPIINNNKKEESN